MSADVGFLAALLLTISPGVFALSRYAILDTLFTACLFGGVVDARGGRARGSSAAAVRRLCAARGGDAHEGPAGDGAERPRIPPRDCCCPQTRAGGCSALHWVSGLADRRSRCPRRGSRTCWRASAHAFVDGYILNENLTLFSNAAVRESARLVVLSANPRGRVPAVDAAARRPAGRRCAGAVKRHQRARHLRSAAVVVDRRDRRVLHVLRASSSITTCFPPRPRSVCLLRARVGRCAARRASATAVGRLHRGCLHRPRC